MADAQTGRHASNGLISREPIQPLTGTIRVPCDDYAKNALPSTSLAAWRSTGRSECRTISGSAASVSLLIPLLCGLPSYPEAVRYERCEPSHKHIAWRFIPLRAYAQSVR